MNTTKLYPLKFQPIFKYRIWGGNKLKNELQKNIDGDQIGESWEISDVSGDETLVMEGELKGYTLKKLIQEYKSDFLGQSVYENFGDAFPLLIKIIDANLPLSIQVHPGDEVAKERHQSFGKNEMWYIMDADEGAELIVGFKKQTTTTEYLSKLDKGEVLDLLNIEKVKSEDVFTSHLAGFMLLEPVYYWPKFNKLLISLIGSLTMIVLKLQQVRRENCIMILQKMLLISIFTLSTNLIF